MQADVEGLEKRLESSSSEVARLKADAAEAELQAAVQRREVLDGRQAERQLLQLEAALEAAQGRAEAVAWERSTADAALAAAQAELKAAQTEAATLRAQVRLPCAARPFLRCADGAPLVCRQPCSISATAIAHSACCRAPRRWPACARR